jgi:hydrogenase maturation protease
VIEALHRSPLPAGVRAEDGASDSLLLSSLWRGEPEIWIVDAIIRGDAPGTLHRLGHDELIAVPQRHGTAHHLSLPESLRWMAITYPDMAGVRYRMWGVEPETIEPRPGLSSAIVAAVERLVGEIVDSLKELRD